MKDKIKSNQFVGRFQDLINSSGKMQKDISKELGVSKQKITKWKKGYVEPSLDDIILIARYFQVTTDYLLGAEE